MKFLIESRTKNQIFEDWKGTDKISKSWQEYWDNCLIKTIKLYEQLNWKLIAIVYNGKVPLAHRSWPKTDVSYQDALVMLKNHFNIGVNLYKSNLIVADIDDNNIPIGLKSYVYKTMTAITTSSHYHIYFDYDKEYNKDKLNELAIKLGYTKPELWRGKPNKPQYTLIPLSFVNKKFYEWIYSDNLMGISELMRKEG